jgi:hypothetical protein
MKGRRQEKRKTTLEMEKGLENKEFEKMRDGCIKSYERYQQEAPDVLFCFTPYTSSKDIQKFNTVL